jgi:hypothetical protein
MKMSLKWSCMEVCAREQGASREPELYAGGFPAPAYRSSTVEQSPNILLGIFQTYSYHLRYGTDSDAKDKHVRESNLEQLEEGCRKGGEVAGEKRIAMPVGCQSASSACPMDVLLQACWEVIVYHVG